MSLLFALHSRQVPPLLGAPPGTVPNFVDPFSRGQAIVIASIVLSAFALLFVIVRVAVKLFITKRPGWDDVFACGALGFSIARTVLSCVLVDVYGIGVHIWDFNPVNITGAHNIQFIEDMVYLLGIMCAKLSILIFYVKVFHVKQRFRYLCYVMMATTVIYCLIFFFIIAFDCEDEYYTWHFSFTAKCIEITTVTVAIGAVNIATDLIIMVMPLPLIWHLHLGKSQKLGLLAVFGTGLFVFVSTVVREVIVIQTDKEIDQSWAVVDEVIWLTVELNIAIICISLPMLSPLYTRVLATKFKFSSIRNLLSSLRSRTKYSGETGGDSKETSGASSSPYNETLDLVNTPYSQSTMYGESVHEGQNYTKYPIPKGGISVRLDIDQRTSSREGKAPDIV